MRKHRGWIALDIDGTITDATHHVPKEVAHFLHSVYEKGWEIVFITGRAYAFAHPTLHIFSFPFYLAVQNGADVLHMPSKQLIARNYLDSQTIDAIEKLYRGIADDFIVYSGYDHGDFCYYRPIKFSHVVLEHLRKIMPFSMEPWRAVDHFAFEKGETFPLIKCIGRKAEMQHLEQKLQSLSSIATSLIRDPLDHDRIYLILVTHENATKGKALLRIIEAYGARGPIIAAGDDFNDVTMLEEADFKIVMENAPLNMHPMADFLAKSSQQQGIIKALEKAMSQCSR